MEGRSTGLSAEYALFWCPASAGTDGGAPENGSLRPAVDKNAIFMPDTSIKKSILIGIILSIHILGRIVRRENRAVP